MHKQGILDQEEMDGCREGIEHYLKTLRKEESILIERVTREGYVDNSRFDEDTAVYLSCKINKMEVLLNQLNK